MINLKPFEQSSLTHSPSVKLYSVQQIRWTTFLVGPFVAAWMLSHNFRQLGTPRRPAAVLWLVASMVVFGLMALLHRRPGNYAVPAALIAIGSSEFAKRRQEVAIKAHVDAGGSIQPLRQCFAVALYCLGLSLIAAEAYVTLTPH